jgi:predicted dehydrogenase
MRATRRSTIAAVASRAAARATAYAREWDIPVAHDTYDALLHDRSVDAIYIPLPNALHVEWTLRALDAGKHVLCEKPLALVPEDVDRIEAVARATGLVAAEAFMYRHEPLIARVVELLDSGAIGTLQLIAAGFTYTQSRSPDARLDATLGGGSLWDIGCYAVSASRFVVRSEPVEAFGMANVAAHGVDDAFSGLLRFRDGVVASVHSGFRAEYRNWLELSGSAGVIRVANPFRPGPRELIEVTRGDETSQHVVDGSPSLFVRQIEDFVAAALDGKPPTIPLRESRGNAAALAALYASARSGCVVTI